MPFLGQDAPARDYLGSNQAQAPTQRVLVFNDTGAAVNNGDVFFLSWIGGSGASERPRIVACATSAVPRQIVVVDQSGAGKTSIGDDEWGYVTIAGYCKKVACAATVAPNDFLQGVNGTAVSADDGTAQTADSFAIAVTDEDATPGFCEAILFGEPVTIG